MGLVPQDDAVPSTGQAAESPPQTSMTSHGVAGLTARQVVSGGMSSSSGHSIAAPSHVSATSQTPAAARHGVAAGWTVSTGQAFEPPSQCSIASHSPAGARQIVPTGYVESAGQ